MRPMMIRSICKLTLVSILTVLLAACGRDGNDTAKTDGGEESAAQETAFEAKTLFAVGDNGLIAARRSGDRAPA